MEIYKHSPIPVFSSLEAEALHKTLCAPMHGLQRQPFPVIPSPQPTGMLSQEG